MERQDGELSPSGCPSVPPSVPLSESTLLDYFMGASGSTNDHGGARRGGRNGSAGRAGGGAGGSGASRRRGAAGINGAGRAAKAAGASRAGMAGGLKWVIPSDYDAGQEVQQRILGDAERCGFSANSLFALRLALDEAMVNAIKHGNRLDPKKKVRVEATVTPEAVRIQIEDEGPGFDRRRIPDPTADENLCRCSGRGILLIESYMNGARWDKGGRRLRMVRYNEPDELPARRGRIA